MMKMSQNDSYESYLNKIPKVILPTVTLPVNLKISTH